MLNDQARQFHRNWLNKASNIQEGTLEGVFDKFQTLYVIYCNLFSNVPIVLIEKGHALPKRISDNKLATKYVVNVMSEEHLERLVDRHSQELTELAELIRSESFYINLYYGARQRNEDLLLLDQILSPDVKKKVLGLLSIIYNVRCNIVHGHKVFVQYQIVLLIPIIRILETSIEFLYEDLR
ncbi:MAG: hypothetical protein RIF46_06280 [Cyclobacteriaceae bacterium]